MKVLNFTTLGNFLKKDRKLNSPIRFHSSKPDILFVADMEATVIPLDSQKKVALVGDYLSNNIKALQKLNERALKVLSTGSDVQRVSSFKDTLRAMWYDLVFLNNGKELYLGDNLLIENRGANIKTNIAWRTLVEEHAGWKVNDLVSVTKSLLDGLGFFTIDHHYKVTYKNNMFMGNESGIELAINPTNGSIFVMKNDKFTDTELKVFTEAISRRILELYSERTNKELQYQISEFGEYYNIFFETKELKVNKLTSTEAIPDLFETSFLENIRACIVAGDSENDEHLKLEQININAKQIPVFSLHSGQRLQSNPDFNKHERMFVSPIEGNISETLEKIVNVIDTL